jgi:hypothetical protein
MSNNSFSRVGRDRLRAAGSSSVKNPCSTAACLTTEKRPSTPTNLVKYRRSATLPGQRTVHYGSADDLIKYTATRAHLPASKQAFGKEGKASEHVHDVFAHGPQNEVENITMNFAEGKYRLTNVPIGKPRPTGIQIPEHLRVGNTAFGIKAKQSEAAKGIIFPEDNGDDLHPDIYIKSHGSYVPGAQTKRNYDWSTTSVNPQQHTFGKAEHINGESAAACISQKKKAGTRVVTKAQVDYMVAKVKRIGKPTSYGNHTDKNRTFGQASDPKAKPSDWGAGDCIRGEYGNEADPKLGKSTNKGYRNVTTETRAFGCPSIRDDVPPPKNRSVSDNQNYGTDVQARALLFPSQFASIGVHDEDFTEQRPPSVIRTIFAKIGQSFTDDEFTRIWWRAATACDINQDGIVSVTEFKSAVNEFNDAKETGIQPSWWKQAGVEGLSQLTSDVADSRQ